MAVVGFQAMAMALSCAGLCTRRAATELKRHVAFGAWRARVRSESIFLLDVMRKQKNQRRGLDGVVQDKLSFMKALLDEEAYG